LGLEVVARGRRLGKVLELSTHLHYATRQHNRRSGRDLNLKRLTAAFGDSLGPNIQHALMSPAHTTGFGKNMAAVTLKLDIFRK